MIRYAILLMAVSAAASALTGAQGPPQPGKDRVKIGKLQMQGAGERPKSFLGIGVKEVDAAAAKERKLAEERGVEITQVSEDSAAARAGLQKGDIILEYSGQPVQGIEQFVRLVRETPPGRKLILKIDREGRTQTVDAVMGTCEKCGSVFAWGGAPDLDELRIEIPQLPNPNVWRLNEDWFPDTPHVFTTWRSSQLGIEAEALESQLAGFFGVKEGVLVRSVSKNSAAEKAGLRAGDVITKAGASSVAKPRDVSRAMREANSGSMALTIVREKREMTLTVTLERGPSGDGGIQRLISEEITRL
ncbi:MAG: PDZ domain-containing protein [Bryobacteraceae bacterium]|nr:PDZ domain-containing protein [Bryobacteraceae bacterium]